MARQELVKYAGKGEGGGDLFDMSLGWPDDEEGLHASARQMAAIERFYGLPQDYALTDLQAHVLLCARDYAEGMSDHLFPRLFGLRRKRVAAFAAAFISQNEQITGDVVAYMEGRFDRGSDPDGLLTQIKRSKSYDAVSTFLRDVVADMRDAGADL